MAFVSWHMFKTCAAVLKSRPALALFPVLAGCACLAVALSVVVPLATMDASVTSFNAAYFICTIAFLVLVGAVAIL
ncbi:hypothetical protein [Nocardia sp. NPDC052112]|uniref:hypothetical protein n=1 Tax=Nocardia sp. NPDC052112 TaxID=3155646 RepID=UPI003438DEB4